MTAEGSAQAPARLRQGKRKARLCQAERSAGAEAEWACADRPGAPMRERRQSRHREGPGAGPTGVEALRPGAAGLSEWRHAPRVWPTRIDRANRRQRSHSTRCPGARPRPTSAACTELAECAPRAVEEARRDRLSCHRTACEPPQRNGGVPDSSVTSTGRGSMGWDKGSCGSPA